MLLRGQVKSGFCQVSVRAACDSAVLMSARATRFLGTLRSSFPTFLHILRGSTFAVSFIKFRFL